MAGVRLWLQHQDRHLSVAANTARAAMEDLGARLASLARAARTVTV